MDFPLSLQIALVTLLGTLLGGQLNRGIYGWVQRPRPISPWARRPAGLPARDWLDCVPVVGWFRLRREAKLHGAGFWVRPALIELGFGATLGFLYPFVIQGGLLPVGVPRPPLEIAGAQFLALAILLAAMVVATFTDLDDKTIPDEVTVPGTLLAVLLAGLLPNCLLPAWRPSAEGLLVDRLLLTSPQSWRADLSESRGWWLAVACILAWWYALLPKTLWYRSGPVKFFRYLLASILRHRLTLWISLLAMIAGAATTWCWKLGGVRWQAVLTAWIGMAVGGGVVWLVRIVASTALGKEAMGFGDVTLLGMIGAFLAWQTSLLVFFIAPFTGALLAIGQWLLTRRKDVAYGPFLCSATLLVLLTWPAVWNAWGYPIFSLGWFVPAVLFASLIVLGAVLWVIGRLQQD